jgi:DNA-binding NtrC family response regulator
MQQRVGEAEALRNELAKQGTDVSALDRAIEAMKSVATRTDDSKAAADLRAQVIDGLKAFEFALRKSLGEQESGRVMSGRTGDVPPAFRAYVEEYYRAIAKPPKP